MSQFLPKAELQKIEAELQSAVNEYLESMKLVKQEENLLEEELVHALEGRKMEDVKKKLYE